MYPDAHKLYLTHAQRSELGLRAGSLVDIMSPNRIIIACEVLMPARLLVDAMNTNATAMLVCDGWDTHPTIDHIRASIEDARPVPDDLTRALDCVLAPVVAPPEPSAPTPITQDDPDDDDDFNWRQTS